MDLNNGTGYNRQTIIHYNPLCKLNLHNPVTLYISHACKSYQNISIKNITKPTIVF